MSTSYGNFAYVYDTFMDNIPYAEWSRYLIALFSKFQITSGTLAELGCGTGTMSLLMNNAGYKIIGIDNSLDMLAIASDKTANYPDITLILQDMRQLELGTSLDGIYCICDSLNYLLTSDDLLETFKKVKEHLKRNGIFIFDLKTLYFYKDILGDQIFCDHQENCSYTWENNFFEEDNINQYDLTIFAKDEDDRYTKFEETHLQRGYSIDEIKSALNDAGLIFVDSFSAFTKNQISDTDERIYIIAKECGK